MFIEALFMIDKTWKQPKRPSTEEWINKMWYIYTMEYYSAISRKEIMPFAATWMQLEIIILSKSERARQIPYNITDRASLVAQWLRIRLPMQGTRVRALVWEDPTCHGATRPVSHNY